MDNGVSPPRTPEKQHKQPWTDEMVISTPEDLRFGIEMLTNSPEAINCPTRVGKRKREESPEQSAKKSKTAEATPELPSDMDIDVEDPQKLPKLETCPECGCEYDPKNNIKECYAHPGELTPTSDLINWLRPSNSQALDQIEEANANHCHAAALL